MIILKQVIHYPGTNSVEATWVDQISPEIEVPESKSPDTIDQSTGALIPSVVTPANVIQAVEIPVKCHSYADVQMDIFRADVAELGGDIAEHEEMIASVIASIKPVEPPTKQEISAQAQQEIDTIEAKTMMNRAVREGMLAMTEFVASTKGVTPDLLYTQNAAYKSVKDVDKQISQLRKKLK